MCKYAPSGLVINLLMVGAGALGADGIFIAKYCCTTSNWRQRTFILISYKKLRKTGGNFIKHGINFLWPIQNFMTLSPILGIRASKVPLPPPPCDICVTWAIVNGTLHDYVLHTCNKR